MVHKFLVDKFFRSRGLKGRIESTKNRYLYTVYVPYTNENEITVANLCESQYFQNLSVEGYGLLSVNPDEQYLTVTVAIL